MDKFDDNVKIILYEESDNLGIVKQNLSLDITLRHLEICDDQSGALSQPQFSVNSLLAMTFLAILNDNKDIRGITNYCRRNIDLLIKLGLLDSNRKLPDISLFCMLFVSLDNTKIYPLICTSLRLFFEKISRHVDEEGTFHKTPIGCKLIDETLEIYERELSLFHLNNKNVIRKSKMKTVSHLDIIDILSLNKTIVHCSSCFATPQLVELLINKKCDYLLEIDRDHELVNSIKSAMGTDFCNILNREIIINNKNKQCIIYYFTKLDKSKIPLNYCGLKYFVAYQIGNMSQIRKATNNISYVATSLQNFEIIIENIEKKWKTKSSAAKLKKLLSDDYILANNLNMQNNIDTFKTLAKVVKGELKRNDNISTQLYKNAFQHKVERSLLRCLKMISGLDIFILKKK